MNEYIYLGIVEEVACREVAGETKQLVRIEQRNKFCVGDHIEIMKPDGRNVEVEVLSMYNGELEPVESCPHSKQVIWLELSEEPKQYDLLRVKA